MGSPTHTTSPPPAALGRSSGWPPPGQGWEPPPSSHPSWATWTAATVASIWTAVALISVFAPDMVSGSEQQRMPVAAFSTWLWGSVATVAFVVTMIRARRATVRPGVWISLSAATIALWTAATLVSVLAPTMVTGSDPTTIPLGALISPIAAMLATTLAGAGALAATALPPARRSA